MKGNETHGTNWVSHLFALEPGSERGKVIRKLGKFNGSHIARIDREE